MRENFFLLLLVYFYLSHYSFFYSLLVCYTSGTRGWMILPCCRTTQSPPLTHSFFSTHSLMLYQTIPNNTCFLPPGDSRGVLCRGGLAHPLSEDHKPTQVPSFFNLQTPLFNYIIRPNFLLSFSLCLSLSLCRSLSLPPSLSLFLRERERERDYNSFYTRPLSVFVGAVLSAVSSL